MPAPYSYHFRQKAIDAYKRGERKTDICRWLKISRNTLDLWLKREKQTGDFRAKIGYQKMNLRLSEARRSSAPKVSRKTRANSTSKIG